MYLNYEEDRDLAAWAHAITGAIYNNEYEMTKQNEDQGPLLEIILDHGHKAWTLLLSILWVWISPTCTKSLEIQPALPALQHTYEEMIQSDPDNL